MKAVERALWAMLVFACTTSSCTAPDRSALAVVSITCGEYTVRLSLRRTPEAGSSRQPPFVYGVRWRAEVEAPPTARNPYDLGRPLRAGLETFTVRGQQGDRQDTWIGEWRSSSPLLVVEGPIRLSEGFGPLTTEDRGDLFFSVYPPDAPRVSTPHISFAIRPIEDRLEIHDVRPGPPAECIAAEPGSKLFNRLGRFCDSEGRKQAVV
jgi:hypothetical protein